MTHDRFIELWAERIRHHPNERLGQALFNALHEWAPTLAEQMRGTEFDPFYRSNQEFSAIADSLLWIADNWRG